jgi:hypothetical protein
MQLMSGNARKDGREFGFWFVGDIQRWTKAKSAAKELGLRQSTVLEMKWGVHRAGETRSEWASCSVRRTLSILLSGKFTVSFRSPATPKKLIKRRLKKTGDYVAWGTDVEHLWRAEEDSVILTVRWLEPATVASGSKPTRRPPKR